MKVNLGKTTKTVLKIASLMIVLITTIVAICMSQASFKSALTEEQLFENRVAKNYNELTNDDKETNVTNVKFGAYFLRDLNGDNTAHMLDGTCKRIGSTDELYFDIAVSGDSYIDNARIKITNANFNAQFNYLKDDYLKDNYKGTYDEIQFNRIEGGSEEQIYGSIKYRAISNYNDYSKTAIITFTAEYHDIYTGETAQVEKQVPITVDWYGNLNTSVKSNASAYRPGGVPGNTVSTSFEYEEFSDLLLKDRKIEIQIPNIRDWEPVTARLSDENAIYNPETKTLTLITESTFDSEGNCTNSIPKNGSYTIYITYPGEAFVYNSNVSSNDIFTRRDSIKCETVVTTHAYNNQGTEFENIKTSNSVVYPSISFTENEQQPGEVLRTTINAYYEHDKKVISIQNILENYEGVKNGEISANNIQRNFDTHLIVQRGDIKDFELFEVEDEYFKLGGSDASNYLKDIRIETSGVTDILEDDGKMLIYNAETGELIQEKTKQELQSNSEIVITEGVGRIKIQLTNLAKCGGTTRRSTFPREGTWDYAGKLADIYIKKSLDVNAIINDFDYTTIKNFSNYYSKLNFASYIKGTGQLEYSASLSGRSGLKYDKTDAMITVNPSVFGNNYEIDEDSDEVGEEIRFIVSSRHNIDCAYWGKGEFIVELPNEFNYFDLDNVTSNTCTINGYEYFEEDGKKLIRVFAETDAQILFNINAHVLIDPTATNGNKTVKLYYKNERCADYVNGTVIDQYDVDLNENKTERIGYATTSVTITSPSTFIVKQMVTNYDDSGAFTTAPNVAEVDKEANHATVEIGVKNNNASPVVDCFLVGKILYEGNTKVKSNTNLRSEYTTHMTSEGITVPEDMENVVVYYSENDAVNFDLSDASNGWTLKENVTDWSKIKSYLIDLSQMTLRSGDSYHVFKYDVSVPNGLSYNAVSYCTVASKYNLQTSAGILYGRGTEAQKTGIRIVRKYDLAGTLLKETTTRRVPDENYVVEELDSENNVVKTRVGRANANGELLIKNLYAERNYRIRQTTTHINYEKDDNVRYFRADENAEADLVFSYPNNQTDLFNNTPYFTKNSETNKDVLNVSIWETPKYEVVINKLDRTTEQPISGVNFMMYNGNISVATQTGSNGKATMRRFSEGTNYTLEEITAKGYYLQDTSLRVVKNAQYNYSVVVGNNEFVNSATANNGGAGQDLAVVELTLYNNAVPTYTLNVVKVKEGTEATPLSGAEFEITKYDDNEKATITTDENGTATVLNMYQYKEGFDDISGKYGLQETTAPRGYVLNKEYIEFVVSKDTNDTLKIEYKDADSLTTIKDTVIDGDNVTIYIQDKALFKLTKTDDEQRLLPNVAFVIYELDANGEILDYARDANDEYIGTRNESGAYEVRTDAYGEITVPLRDGDYMIFEVEAPEQYEYSTTGRKFRVNSQQQEVGSSTGETTEEKYTYQVQYYYNGQRDDSKTETYEVDPNTEVTTYVDKVQDGYELQYVTKLPYKIECDDLAIDVYYATPKTDTLEINYIEDLIDLQIAVNNGNNYENTKVILNRSLDFNDDASYRDPEGTTYGDYNEDETVEGIKAEVTSGRGWKSIGVASRSVQTTVNGDYVLDENQNKVNPYGITKFKYFSGTFDGNNNSISNMYVDLSSGEAYEDPDYIYNQYGTEYKEYYNAALFGWTHNATIMNLKFDGDIYEGRGRNDSYDREIGSGAGLVGNSYGSINLFNVENNLTGNFDNGGAIGRIYQRINTNDTENTNINVQDVKNTINTKATPGFSVDSEIYYNNEKCTWSGLIGYCYTPTQDKDSNSFNNYNPEIVQNIEINNVKNVMKDIDGETNNDDWGVISGMSGHNGSNSINYNDTCKLYRIDSYLEAKYCGSIGGAINYMNRYYMAELKINDVKSKVTCQNLGDLSGGIGGYIYPTGVSNCVIENFDVEMNGGSWGSEVAGVYGYASGSNATINIKNGKVTLNNVTSSSMCGGIVGGTFGYSVNISNVNAYGKIYSGSDMNGGIIGYAASGNDNLLINIEDTNNYAEIEGSERCGGIIGATYGYPVKIKNVNNYGNVTTRGYYAGGIVGLGNSTDNSTIELDNCANMGTVDVGQSGGAGFVGYSYYGTIVVKNSHNLGTIRGETGSYHEYIGGLVGYATGNGKAQIFNSYNKGDIIISGTGSQYYIGGLVGEYAAIVQDSYNEGNIIITADCYGVGGIAGYSGCTNEGIGLINNVINKGKISIHYSGSDTMCGFGGLIGANYGATVSNAINQGDIEILLGQGKYYAIGGISGWNYSGNIYNAYNNGNITLLGGGYATGDNWIGLGGIVGNSTNNYNSDVQSKISTCYNTGKIVSMISAGGIAGGNYGIIEDCYNEGKVISYRERVGGIAGKSTGPITNTYNVGSVVAKNASVKIGPIVADRVDNDGSLSNVNNSYYSDKITFVGEDVDYSGIKQQDSYMRTRDFYNELNTDDVWYYMNGQYPKLMITAGEKIAEAAELNIINNHKVYSISTMLNNENAGTITGYGQDYVEQVRHGEDNTQEIEMIPNEGYIIGRVSINGKDKDITLNDDSSYKITAGELENITSDVIVYVEFIKEDQVLTITKVDKDTNERLPGVTFDIQQVETSPVEDDISEMQTPEIENAYVPDLNSNVDDTIGSITMTRGSYTAIDGGYKFTAAYDRYQNGYRYYAVKTKIAIDLTEHTGKYVIVYDTNLTDSMTSYLCNSNNETVTSSGSRNIANNARRFIFLVDGGQSYYIKHERSRSGSTFTENITNLHVYTASNYVYPLAKTQEGYLETTNENIPLAICAESMDIDLTNHPEDYLMTIRYKRIGGVSGLNLKLLVTNSDTGAEVYNKSYSVYYNEQEYGDILTLTGGIKYKVEIKYENTTGGEGKIQITTFTVKVDQSKFGKARRTTNSNGEIKVQLPVGKYQIKEIEAPEHYVVSTEPTEYTIVLNQENKVTIENNHKPIVRVHHYLMENGEMTTKKVAEDEEYEGDIDEDYYFNPKADLKGLSLAKDDNGEFIIPSNYKGKYALGVTDVNFYYEAEDIKLTIHHYLEGTQTKVAEDEVIVKDAVVEFKRGTSYTVSTTGTYVVGENAKYQELTAGEYDLTSLYSSVQAGIAIDDTLEYSTNAELIYNYNAKKYRIVTRVIEHEEVVFEDEEESTSTDTTTPDDTNTGDTTNPDDTTGETTGDNTGDTGDTTNSDNTTGDQTTTDSTETTTPKTKTISVKGGTISGYDLEYYEELASNANSTKDIIVTPDRGYKIKEIKLNETVIYDADHTTSDLYTVDENGVVTFNRFNNVIEDKTITVEFEGIGSIVKVHHVLVEKGKPDEEYKTIEVKGRIGSRYVTESIEIPGYTLYSTSLNTTGEITEDIIDVYYNYKANPETTYTIRYFYDTVEDTELAERLTRKTGTTVTIEDIQAKIDAHKKDVYEFERAENIPLMIVNENDEYVIKIYYISTYGKVTEKHIDAGHNTLLYTETHKGSIGARYNIQPRNIEGYTLKTTDLDGNNILPTNAKGTYVKDVIDVVTYYYSRNTTVKVIYQDENEKELDKVIIEGHEGDEYTTEEKTIKGYELVETPKNAEGVMLVRKDAEGKDNTETLVIYKYKKLIPGDVIERYVDINTDTPVEEITHKGELDEEYEIVPKTIEGYTLITKDKDGNDILPTNTKGKFSTEKVEVIYYVAVNTTVRVQYINLITREKMTDDVIIKGYEGQEYKTEAKTFEGYELTGTPEEAKGKMKVTLDEDGNKVTELAVKYYYAQKLDGKLPQTSETNSKQAILISIPFVVLINLGLATVAFKKSKKENENE